MAIPDYQSLMLSVLKIAGDGNEHNGSETITQLAGQFGLSPFGCPNFTQNP